MTSRMRWLILAGATVLGLYSADSAYRSWIEQPTSQLTAQINDLSGKLKASKSDQLVANKQGRRLEWYVSRALPDDPMRARSLYQQWLLNLVDTHEVTGASVDAAQPIPVEIRSRTKKGKRQRIGYRIGYSMRGQATLARTACFLNDFRKAGHLHKIRSLSLNPIGTEGRLDVDLAIEVLCLNASVNHESLGNWEWLDKESVGSESNDALVRRNLFARGFAKALHWVGLKAITSNREGKAEAWFQIDAKGTVKSIQAGAQIPLALHDLKLLEILPNKVLVNVNQDDIWIQLGQSIGDVYTQNKELGDKLP